MVYGLILALALTAAQEEAIPDEEDPPRPQILPQKPKPAQPKVPQAPVPVTVPPPVPPSNYDINIDQTARARAEATNALEGGFDLRLVSGMGLYHLELRYDPASQHMSGAWRSFVIVPGQSHSGLIDQLDLAGDRIEIGFVDDRDKSKVRISLSRNANGAWTGTSQTATSAAAAVVLNRSY